MQHRIRSPKLAARSARLVGDRLWRIYRLDNDVAAVADPYTGFDIYSSYAYETAALTRSGDCSRRGSAPPRR